MFARILITVFAAGTIVIGSLAGASASVPEAGQTVEVSKGKGNGTPTGKIGEVKAAASATR